VRVAIGEGDRAHPLRKYRRKDLADSASAVVANQIHAVDIQYVQKIPKHRYGSQIARAPDATRCGVFGWPVSELSI
jgi:hypothetical protein